jgi:hypothetical protein
MQISSDRKTNTYILQAASSHLGNADFGHYEAVRKLVTKEFKRLDLSYSEDYAVKDEWFYTSDTSNTFLNSQSDLVNLGIENERSLCIYAVLLEISMKCRFFFILQIIFLSKLND